MESTSTMYTMPPRENTRRFIRRKGQEAWRHFIDVNPDRHEYPGRFPTGYGKTECIIDGFDRLWAHTVPRACSSSFRLIHKKINM